jgi:3-oxoadipate enol-lactonase
MNRIALANERSGIAEDQPVDQLAVDRLAELDLPMLVLVGTLDLADIRMAADLLAEHVPAAETAVIDGAAHLPALERPDEVGPVLAAFLARVDGARTGG